MYKKELKFTNLKWLIYHKANQTKPNQCKNTLKIQLNKKYKYHVQRMRLTHGNNKYETSWHAVKISLSIFSSLLVS